jgi:hypothetical protein
MVARLKKPLNEPLCADADIDTIEPLRRARSSDGGSCSTQPLQSPDKWRTLPFSSPKRWAEAPCCCGGAFCCPQRFRGSLAGLYAPLPTLRRRPRGPLRKAGGRCGSLLLHHSGVSQHTPVSRRTHSRYGPLACSTARGRLCRRFDPASQPAKSLVSYQGYRQLPRGTSLHW